MCHRRSDWSRTPSRASEPEDEPADDREWWGVRARERLASFVSAEEETPANEREPPATVTESNRNEAVEDDAETASDTGDERESEPVLADG